MNEIESEPEVILIEPGRQTGSRLTPILIVSMILVASIVGYGVLKEYDNGNKDQSSAQDDGAENGGTDDWLTNYTPVNHRGSGPGDWWIPYPDQHPYAGDPVDHPQWVLDSLGEKPVVLLVHRYDCGQDGRNMM